MGWFDKVFKKSPAVPPSLTRPIGRPGTAIIGGSIVSNERNPSLHGSARYVTYSNILANVSVVSASVRYFLNLVGKAEWKIEPADVDGREAEAEEAAELIEYVINNMRTPWNRVVRRGAMYKFYGFSLQEMTATVLTEGEMAGKIGLLDIEPRPQATIEDWYTDKYGTVLGVGQRIPATQEVVTIPISKLLYIVDDSLNDSPEGLGLFRHIVQAATELMRFEQLEGFGFETDLRGIPVGRGPFALLKEQQERGEINETERLMIERPLKDFIKNHIKTPQLGLVLDSMPYETNDDSPAPTAVRQWDIELLKAQSSAQPEVAEAIMRKNWEIARVLGTQSLLLGSNDRGSFALSADQSRNFTLIVDSSLKELCNAVRHSVFKLILELNGIDLDLLPEVKIEALQFGDAGAISAILKDLAMAGAPLMPTDPAINEIRDLLGLSKADEESAEAQADMILNPPKPEPAGAKPKPAPAKKRS